VRRISILVAVITTVGCAANPRPHLASAGSPEASRDIIQLLNRTTFGPRPGDRERVEAIGIAAYVDLQLHPERVADNAVELMLGPLAGLRDTPRAFAADYYLPMAAARLEFTRAQNPPRGVTPVLRGHLLPIAAMTLPGGDRPVTILQQNPVTFEELRYQRENQLVFDDLRGQKLLRAVYSERQLQEVLTDFWFNHFNVDAQKVEDKPVVAEYERDVIRPRVFGRFRDLLEATAKSPAMLFYLDNWLNSAPKGLNENYGRELMELHTLGVDGGYTQADVINVARAFTGWTMSKPREATGFEFNDRKHDHAAKRVLGHTLKAGRGIQDGEDVLDILARHPSTARFIATKLVRRFVADDPPPALVDRAARTFRRSDGDLREVMRVILTAPEFYAAGAYRAKTKTPFELVTSALRATAATVTNTRTFVASIAGMGEPLYQCQPPTGYGDRQQVWVNTGTLVTRMNFAYALAANGLNAARIDPLAAGAPARFAADILDNDISPQTRGAIDAVGRPGAARLSLLLGSPEFQRR
jgi:uncharacterized protein (DUF1800 family)